MSTSSELRPSISAQVQDLSAGFHLQGHFPVTCFWCMHQDAAAPVQWLVAVFPRSSPPVVCDSPRAKVPGLSPQLPGSV